jgi:hypothetical protein
VGGVGPRPPPPPPPPPNPQSPIPIQNRIILIKFIIIKFEKLFKFIKKLKIKIIIY